jgi:hypothetical protein
MADRITRTVDLLNVYLFDVYYSDMDLNLFAGCSLRSAFAPAVLTRWPGA